MHTIFKYPFKVADEQSISLPKGASIVHMGLELNGEPCFWAYVDTEADVETKTLYVRGTGQPAPFKFDRILGSFIAAPFVWHVFIS